MNRGRVQVMALAATGCAVFMANVDNTVMMLPQAQAIGTSVVQLQWVLNAYTLTAASLVLTSGIIANVYGRKRVLLAGLLVFLLASFICTLAPNLEILIVGRILQGIGAASVIPTSIFIFSSSAKGHQKPLYLALWLGISVFGLWAGCSWSEHADALGWQSIFLLNVAVGAIAFGVIARNVKEVVPQGRQKLNLLAAIAVSIIVWSVLFYALRQGIDGVWRSPFVLWLLTVNGLSILAFLAVEYRDSYLLQLRCLPAKVLSTVNFVSALAVFTVFSLLVVLNAWLPSVQAQTQDEAEATPVSLLTPASDLVQGGFSNFELLFGRAGNDTIYSDDPDSSRQQNTDVDFLFGDIFDNSLEEFEIIRNIQFSQQGGNPLLILERNIPSIGQDRFVLGDFERPYYASADPGTLLTTNFLGLNEFAVIYDFDPNQDTIQLNGKLQDYRLIDVNNLTVEGIQQPFFGKAIVSLQQGAPDLIGYIISRPEVTLDLKAKYFQFVGTKPQGRPGRSRKIGQLGTTGNDISHDAATDTLGNVYLTGSTTGPLFGPHQGSTDVWVAKYNSSGTQLWGRQIGSSSGDSAFAVVTDKDGNFYLAGQTSSNLFENRKSQESDLWVAKFNSNGNQIWGKQFDAGGFANIAWGLDVDSAGNVYVSGLSIKEQSRPDLSDFEVEDDSWLIKLDSNGNKLWETQIDTFFFNECYDLAVDTNGNSYITGWTQGLRQESDPSRGLLKYDVWVAKILTNGAVEWIQQIGSIDEGLEFAWAIDTDSQNNVYLTGWTTGQIGTQIVPKGRGKKSRAQGRDIFLIKLNSAGSQLWARQFGSPGDDGMILSDMNIDSADNIFLIGHTNDKLGQGQKDFTYNSWVALFDTNGNNKWIQQFGSKTNLDYPSGVVADNKGNLYVTGFTDGLLGNLDVTNTSGVDTWLAQLNAKSGKVQRFVGGGKLNSVEPGIAPVLDVSNEFVTAERLPTGDNIIKPGGGSTFSYGKLATSLARIFSPNVQNSFPRALEQQVRGGNIQL